MLPFNENKNTKNALKFRPWQDSNLQSSDPKSDALSIRPHGQPLVFGSCRADSSLFPILPHFSFFSPPRWTRLAKRKIPSCLFFPNWCKKNSINLIFFTLCSFTGPRWEARLRHLFRPRPREPGGVANHAVRPQRRIPGMGLVNIIPEYLGKIGVFQFPVLQRPPGKVEDPHHQERRRILPGDDTN